LNGDAILDLCATSAANDEILVFFSDSTASFGDAPDLSLGNFGTFQRPRKTRSADLNNDALVDLAASWCLDPDDRVVFFLQDFRGDFSDPDLMIGDPGVVEVDFLAADLNADGLVDIASTNLESDDVAIFFQRPLGGWLTLPDLLLGDPEMVEAPDCIAAEDLNGDGLVDLVVGSRDLSSLMLYFQGDQGQYSLTPDSVLESSLIDPVDVLAADLDSNGLVDIMTANSGPGTLTAFFQIERGSYSDDPDLTLSSPTAPSSLATDDLNGDGLLDVVSANGLSDSLQIFLQTPDAGFSPSADLSLGDPVTTPRPLNVVLVDFNGDGCVDIASQNLTTVTVFLQAGPGQFAALPDVVLDVPFGLSMVAQDLDVDGEVDIAVTDFVGGVVSVFFGGR
jgi:hypothetical protein